MPNFPIQFTHPWLLLLIIPLIGVALLLYFRVKKKYRRTRNRIISLILHCVACVLCVSVLAGIYIQYDVPNETNEIIFLVDVSDSEEQSAQRRDEFLQNATETARWYEGFRIGVVTFGFDQAYSVPLSADVGGIFDAYRTGERPSETGGTDIAAALTYTRGLFNNPASGKIVLVTDGKETDESAMTVIRAIAAQGTTVDTVYIPSSYTGNATASDVQMVGVEYPDYHLNVGDEFTLNYTLYSTVSASVVVNVYDNDEQVATETVDVSVGSQTYEMQYSFESEDLHEMRFSIQYAGDLIEQNNEYISYYYVEEFNKVLIVERKEGESENLVEVLEEGEYETTVLNLSDPEAEIPQSGLELCIYDQVILNNIANADMPGGFIDVLHSYVNDYGGGMLTLGGKQDDGKTANAYNRSDMYGTTYQAMLPIEAINYTPPVAVMIIIDASGSMGESFDGGDSMLAWARAGASACLDALTERDYIGVMALNSSYDFILPLTRRTQDQTIRRAIASLTETGGGTIFSEAINRAGIALRGQEDVAKRHIIIVTDGAVSQNDEEEYLAAIENLHNTDGVTLSVVGIGVSAGSAAAQQMQTACELGGGRLHTVTDSEELVREMREDLNAPDIKEVNEYENGFYPVAYSPSSNLFNSVTLEDNAMTVTLGGFYGGRVRDNDYLVLAGEYDVPLYALWKYGAGTVGSFMCDLTGSGWSAAFMSDVNGKQFIWNMVNSLMPVSDIEPDPFTVEFDRGNFINRLSIYAELEDGQTVQGRLTSPDGSLNLSLNTGEVATDDCYVTTALSEGNLYSRANFVLKRGGVYLLTLEVQDPAGNVVSSYQTYFNFSYSLEYDLAYDETIPNPMGLMEDLAAGGSGVLITDHDEPVEIFDTFETTFAVTRDPRMALIIAAIVLFLLDVAVRKFKFKWIHEIIRERKEKSGKKDAEASGRKASGRY